MSRPPQPPNKFIKNAEISKLDAYTGLDNTKSIAEAYASIEPVIRTTSSYSSPSVRSGMDRYDYEVFRPGEALPYRRREVLAACMSSYKRVSPIKNIIDMMTDFTTQGIRLVHPNSQIQRFYDTWAEQVNFYEVSQHFVNDLYLFATTVVERQFAKLTAKVVDEIERGIAGAVAAGESDIYDIVPAPKGQAPKYQIPWSYTFRYPGDIEVLGGDLAILAGKPIYAVELPVSLYGRIKNPQTPEDILLVSALPAYIKDAVSKGNRFLRLDQDRLYVGHYKKKDWQEWADPILLSVMDDLVLLQKMKLTDLAALDGAISHIRIWKLGSLTTNPPMMPTKAAFAHLNSILQHVGNGNTMDLMWGPDIELKETTSDIYKYLGEEKYRPVYSSIYSGIGVPSSLIGGSGGGGEKGFTNNSLSLKVIIERLNYGRRSLNKFWTNELSIVQRAMRHRFAAQIEYKHAVLMDEAAFNSLLIDMLDREVVAASAVQEHLGYIPEIQEALLRSERKARSSGKLPGKAGPFHDSDHDYSYKKIFAQTGVVTPSELGVELEDAKKGQKPALLMKQPTGLPGAKTSNSPPKVGVQYQGRPKNSKDTVPRKTKTVLPRTRGDSEFITLSFWAGEAQETISKLVNPVYLKLCKKNSMRELTQAEVEEVEHLKFVLLCNIEPYSEITQSSIATLISQPLQSHGEAENYWKTLVYAFLQKYGRTPGIDEVRQIQCNVYSLYKHNSNFSEAEGDEIGENNS